MSSSIEKNLTYLSACSRKNISLNYSIKYKEGNKILLFGKSVV
ncbi:hypothetical protein O163_13370 [Caldanaerobacter subterraneus subsp. yonseiensis KB-1]|uniref:Uncharacterized protein n=1 Tax=Caldanaerobacter subterraneus subsp. yonseiensis KB-1 TaxID=1388761 RepID=U5CDC5_CALSX|nr:hypothetical protein O163_13370 [Caldanaerobacter subterraneus subsp. yonseiensis KB-1]